jgi:hypothetical protein
VLLYQAAVGLIVQVLDGLAAVHAAGIVHRDLKPANILLAAAGRPILTDFGLARPEHDGEPLTSDGVVLGTPHYMAPEQAAGRGADIGLWTDVYSAAVVFYQMLTGRLPFEGPPLAVLSKIANDPIPPPSRWRPDLPPGLEAVLLRALAKDPRQRFAGAAAFAEALKPLAAAAPAPPTPTADPNLVSAANTVEGRGAPPSRGRGLFQWQRLLLIDALALILWAACWFLLFNGFAKENGWDNLLGLGGIVGMSGTLVLSLFALHCRLKLTPANLFRCAGGGDIKDPVFRPQQLVREILRSGVSVDAKDEFGETALQKAAQAGQSEMVKLLLAHGADANHKNQFGQTALDIAAKKGHADIVDLLRKAGAVQ